MNTVREADSGLSRPQPEPPAQDSGRTGLLPFLTGAAAIAVMVPFMQWLDRGSSANSLELQAPNPLGVGLLVAFVAVNALLALLAVRRRVRPAHALILYVMLTVALPFCSVGVVTPMFGSIAGVARETYWREYSGWMIHLYQWQRPEFYPKLDPAEFNYYMQLRDADFAAERGIVDPRAVRRDIIRPIKQFLVGADITPEVKNEYLNAGGGLKARFRAGWSFVPWRIWRPILIHWGVFLTLVFLGMMLLAQVLYRDWTERENLPFPVAQLPLSLLEPGNAGAAMFRNGFFLGGMAIAALLLLLSGLAHYRFLEIPTAGPASFQRIDFNQILVREPFTYLKNNYLFLSPLLIGIALLVQQEILRGTLLVFLVLQLARLFTGLWEASLSEALGMAWHGNKWPYYPELGAGAAAVFVAVLLWRSRRAFRLRAPAAAGGAAEAGGGYFGGRFAGPLLLAVMAAMGFWWYRMGMTGPSGLFVVAFVIFLAFGLAVAVSRCRAEGGLAVTSTAGLNTRLLAPGIGYASHVAPPNVRALVHGEWMSIAALPNLLAAQIEGLYLAHRLRVRPRAIALAAALAFFVALGVALISHVVLAYIHGGVNLNRRLYVGMVVPMWQLGSDIVHRKAAVDALWCAMVLLGAAAMALLLVIRRRRPKFPLPPICLLLVTLGTVGFQTGEDALHPTYTAGPYVCFIWGPFLIAWLIKKFVLRFGGMDLYVRMIPLALGLICGQCLMIVFWNVFHAAAGPAGVPVFTGVFQ